MANFSTGDRARRPKGDRCLYILSSVYYLGFHSLFINQCDALD